MVNHISKLLGSLLTIGILEVCLPNCFVSKLSLGSPAVNGLLLFKRRIVLLYCGMDVGITFPALEFLFFMILWHIKPEKIISKVCIWPLPSIQVYFVFFPYFHQKLFFSHPFDRLLGHTKNIIRKHTPFSNHALMSCPPKSFFPIFTRKLVQVTPLQKVLGHH